MPSHARLLVVGIVVASLTGFLTITKLTTRVPTHFQNHFDRIVRFMAGRINKPDVSLRYNVNRTSSLTVVETTGAFLESVAQFNQFLQDDLDNRTHNERNGSVIYPYLHQNSQRCISTNPPLQLIWGADDNYLERLSLLPSIQTVYLGWRSSTGRGSSSDEERLVPRWDSRTDYANVLVQNYYDWTAERELCTMIETPGGTEYRYETVFNFTCSSDENSMGVRSLEPLFLNSKHYHSYELFPPPGTLQPAWTYLRPPAFVTFMHIITPGLVTGTGEVFLEGGVKYVPFTCHADRGLGLDDCAVKRPLYDYVFVITTHGSWDIYHRMTEALPRVAFYVDFLRRNPNVVIHAHTGEEKKDSRLREYFSILGISANPIVTGVVSARTVYLPRSTPCHTPNVQEMQLLSKKLRDYIVRTLQPLEERKTLILIRRSKSRWFVKQLEIERVLQKVAQDFNLTYHLFIDDPTPGLNETMRIFHSAVLIVGAHGAGLSNILFSQPGTYVLEAVNKPATNLCFARTAHILGHRWHGLLHKTEPGFTVHMQMSVSVARMDKIVRKFLSVRAVQPSYSVNDSR